MGDDDVAEVGFEAHEALRTLYHYALSTDERDVGAVTDAYLYLVDFLGAPASGVEPARIVAVARLLTDSGDITPTGARILEKIAGEAGS